MEGSRVAIITDIHGNLPALGRIGGFKTFERIAAGSAA